MPKMVRLHGSVQKIWEAVSESYVHPVKYQIKELKKKKHAELLTRLLQSKYIAHLNKKFIE